MRKKTTNGRLFIHLSEGILWITMKRIEIIIPHRKLEAAYEILKNVNAGGMSYYKIEGAGNIKAEPLTVGRGTQQSRPVWHVPRTKVEVVVKDEQVEDLLSKLHLKLRGGQGTKIFVVDVPVAIDITGYEIKRGEEAI